MIKIQEKLNDMEDTEYLKKLEESAKRVNTAVNAGILLVNGLTYEEFSDFIRSLRDRVQNYSKINIEDNDRG